MTLSKRMADHGSTRAISLCVVPYLRKLLPIVVEVLKADDKNDHGADIICDECISVPVSLHAPRAH